MEPRRNITMLMVVCIALSLLWIIFLLYPTFQGVIQVANDIHSQKQEIVLDKLEAKNLADFAGHYSEYQPGFASIDRLFVDSQNPIDFIQSLEHDAAMSGVSTETDVAPSDGKTVSALPVVSFSIAVKGSFSGIVTFLNALEHGQYLIDIEGLTMKRLLPEPDSKKTISPNLEADIVINVATK